MSQKDSEQPTDQDKSEELAEQELAQVAGGAGYLKIGDIKGESTDDGHKDWINLTR